MHNLLSWSGTSCACLKYCQQWSLMHLKSYFIVLIELCYLTFTDTGALRTRYDFSLAVLYFQVYRIQAKGPGCIVKRQPREAIQDKLVFSTIQVVLLGLCMGQETATQRTWQSQKVRETSRVDEQARRTDNQDQQATGTNKQPGLTSNQDRTDEQAGQTSKQDRRTKAGQTNQSRTDKPKQDRQTKAGHWITESNIQTSRQPQQQSHVCQWGVSPTTKGFSKIACTKTRLASLDRETLL
jgi:hypothetical protein